MNPGKFETGSVHYMHLADPSEESVGNCEETGNSVRSIKDNPLAVKLSLIASRGTITKEEYAQLADFINDRGSNRAQARTIDRRFPVSPCLHLDH